MKLLLTALAPVALMGIASAQQGLYPLPAGSDNLVNTAAAGTTSAFPAARATTGCDDFNRTTGLGTDWAPTFGGPMLINNGYGSVQWGNAQYVPASVSYDAASITIDLPDNPQALRYGAVMIGLGGVENLFVKLQCTAATPGVYDAVGFYTGQGTDTSATTGFGGFFGLVTPVTGGWMTIYTDPTGDELHMDLDTNRDGVVDFALIAPNSTLTANGSLLTSFAPGTFGMGVGIGAYGDGVTPDLDDFELNGGCVPQGPTLSILGSCPGVIGVDVTGMTPNGQIALVVGASGSFAVPANRPCPGTQLNLNPMLIPNGPRYFVLSADANGDLNIPALANAPNAACGFAQLVALDLTICAVTNVASL